MRLLRKSRCFEPSQPSPALRSTRYALTLLAAAVSACGYIDYDYLPKATETAEPENAELTLNAGSAEAELETETVSATPAETVAPAPGPVAPIARSLQLTPDVRAIDLALAGDPLPAGYTYALRRSITAVPATPSDGEEVCATCALTLTDSGLSSAYTYEYAGFVYDDSATWVDTLTANAQPLGSWGGDSTQLAYLKAASIASGDRHGGAVSLDATGSTLAVGAWGDGSQNPGAVYVYTRLGDAWTQQAYFRASSTDNFDSFGIAVALSADGRTLAVGANGEDSSASGVNGNASLNDTNSAGAVYVYVLSGSSWVQQAYLKHSHPDVFDQFGTSLALSDDGDTLAIGVPNEESGATGVNGDASRDDVDNSGAAFVFTRSAGTWSQQAYLKASNTGNGDTFGRFLSLSGDGDTLAVGAPQEGSSAIGIDGDESLNDRAGAGAIYVFRRAGVTWSQEAYVKAAERANSSDQCSRTALSQDGNVLAFGCYGEDSSATGIDGDQLLSDASDAGAVHVLERSGSTWSYAAYVKPSTTDAGEWFGYALELSDDGTLLLVGAHNEDSESNGVNGDESLNAASNSGASYLFERESGWSQKAYIKASNSDGNDLFGWAVALAGDGNFMAIGAMGESSTSGTDPTVSSNGAPSAGATYLFAR